MKKIALGIFVVSSILLSCGNKEKSTELAEEPPKLVISEPTDNLKTKKVFNTNTGAEITCTYNCDSYATLVAETWLSEDEVKNIIELTGISDHKTLLIRYKDLDLPPFVVVEKGCIIYDEKIPRDLQEAKKYQEKREIELKEERKQRDLLAKKELAEKERKKRQEEAEREKHRKAEEAKAAANRVGIWSCKHFAGNGQYLYYTIEITKDDKGYVAYISGDYNDTKRLTRRGNRYYFDDGDFGEYYLLNGSSLKICDQDGVINEVKATRKK